MSRRSAAQLRRDARNRALRTFLQGLGLDVLVALSMLVYDALNDDRPDYRLLAATAAKTAAQTVAAYLMRLKLDPSRIPTPLPPDPPGEPDADQPDDAGTGELRLIGLFAAATLLALVVYHYLAAHL